MARITPNWTQPSHPDLVQVIDAPGSFSSFSRSLVSKPPGALLARIDMPPLTFADKAYSTVQVSRTQHIELNCDWLFTNHSCEPSVEFHVMPATGEAPPAIEVRVAARRGTNDGSGATGLRKGDLLTFFYPSTEWEMAQPFSCNCGTKTCKKWISGAKDMGKAQLQGLFLNQHIEDLLLEQSHSHENGLAANGKAVTPEVNGDGIAQDGVIKGRRGASARALAGEMGGDTAN